jgi:hypothetical protein
LHLENYAMLLYNTHGHLFDTVGVVSTPSRGYTRLPVHKLRIEPLGDQDKQKVRYHSRRTETLRRDNRGPRLNKRKPRPCKKGRGFCCQSQA